MIIQQPTICLSARSEKNLAGIAPVLAKVMRIAFQYSLVPFAITEGEPQQEGDIFSYPQRDRVNVVALPAGVVSRDPYYYQLIADAVTSAALLCKADVQWGGQSVVLQSTTEKGHAHRQRMENQGAQ